MAFLPILAGLAKGLGSGMQESTRNRIEGLIRKYERERQEAEDEAKRKQMAAQTASYEASTAQTLSETRRDEEQQRILAALAQQERDAGLPPGTLTSLISGAGRSGGTGGLGGRVEGLPGAAGTGFAYGETGTALPPTGQPSLSAYAMPGGAPPELLPGLQARAQLESGYKAGTTARREAARAEKIKLQQADVGLELEAARTATGAAQEKRIAAKEVADVAREQADRATRQKIVDTSRPVLLAKYGAISDEVRAFDASVPGYVSGATNSLTEPKRLDVVEEIKRKLLEDVDWTTPEGIRLAMQIAGISPTERQQIEASLATWDQLSSTFSPAEQARGRKAIAASLIPTGLQDYVLPEPKEDKLAAIQQYARFIDDPDIREAVTQAAYGAAAADSKQPISTLIEQFLLASYTDKLSRATDPAEIKALNAKIQQLVPSLQTSAFGGKEITANQRENVTRAWETFRAELGVGNPMAPTPEWKRTLQLDLEKDPKDASKGALRADFTDRAIDFTRRYFGESPGGRAFLNEVWPYTGIREEAFEQKIREKGYVPADDVPAWASPAAKASALSPTPSSSPVVPGAPTAAEIDFAIGNIERATTPEQLRYLLKKFPDSASPADQQRANDAADATAKRLGISQAPMPSGVNDWITQANPATQTAMAPGQSFERTPGASPGIPMSQPRATVPAQGPGMQQPVAQQAPPPVGPQVAQAPTLTPDQITAMSRKGISPVVRRQVLRRMRLSEREINRLMQQYQWDRVT